MPTIKEQLKMALLAEPQPIPRWLRFARTVLTFVLLAVIIRQLARHFSISPLRALLLFTSSILVLTLIFLAVSRGLRRKRQAKLPPIP